MAYRVLMGRRHPFLLLEGRTGERCAHEAPRRGIRKDGTVTANGNVTQPIQWSSEYSDSELGLVYYNYRHYNPADGRWIGRDPAPVEASQNNYCYVLNRPSRSNDLIGLAELPCDNNHLGWYRKLEVKILADFMIGDPFELANTSSFTDMVGDFLQGEKEKALDELFKDDEVYAAWKKLRDAGKKLEANSTSF